jgi:Protein of unknown function (DUF2844)
LLDRRAPRLKSFVICPSYLVHHGNPEHFSANPILSTTLQRFITQLRTQCRGLRLTISAFFLLWSLSSFASLGGNVASVQADATGMHARVQSSQHSAYMLHEMQSATGTTVREYVSSSGTVFAVAWKGAYPPNVKQLLGSNYEQYEQAMKKPTGRTVRGPITIRLPNLVVQLSGHMGDYSGRAYIPDQVPAGTSLESIH